jgi:hypothetical protein
MCDIRGVDTNTTYKGAVTAYDVVFGSEYREKIQTLANSAAISDFALHR